jgi:hypothetical protein
VRGDESARTVTEHEFDVAVDCVGTYRVNVLAVEVPPIRREFDRVDSIARVREAVEKPLDALVCGLVSPPENEQYVVVAWVTVLCDAYCGSGAAGTKSHGQGDDWEEEKSSPQRGC